MLKGQEKLSAAVLWAAELHHGQYRDGDCPLPYLAHPLEVLYNLRYIGQCTNIDLLCAAALHDVVEECGVSFHEISKRFGDRVAEYVKEVTRTEPTPSQTEKLNKDQIWALRSQMLLDEIAGMSADAKRIKLADRLSNLKEAWHTREGKKLRRYLKQTRQILELIPQEVSPPLWKSVQKCLRRPR